MGWAPGTCARMCAHVYARKRITKESSLLFLLEVWKKCRSVPALKNNEMCDPPSFSWKQLVKKRRRRRKRGGCEESSRISGTPKSFSTKRRASELYLGLTAGSCRIFVARTRIGHQTPLVFLLALIFLSYRPISLHHRGRIRLIAST